MTGMGSSRGLVGPLVSIVVAIGGGLAIAVIDSRPGWDSTGITAGLLAIVALVAVLLEGSGKPLRAAAIAILVGIWIPILEISAPGANGPLLAFVFSGVGAFIGWVAARGLRRGSAGDEGPGGGAAGGAA
jgi:hypothetical protein